MKTFRLKYKTFLLLLPLCILGVVSSCSDDDDDNGASGFRIIKTEIQSDPAVLEGTIELSSPNFEFEVKHDWCTVVQEGNFLKISAGPNYKFVNRSTEVTIKSGSFKKNVPVTQTGILFEYGGKNISIMKFGLLGGARPVRILSNIDYEVIVSLEDKKWITVDSKSSELGTGEYNIVIDPAEAPRNGVVIFKYLDIELKIDIMQYDYLSYTDLLGPAKMSYKNENGDITEIDIILEEKVPFEEFYVRGTFNGVGERLLPLEYVEEQEGELRFHSALLDSHFEDTENSSDTKTLSSLLYGHQKMATAPIENTFYVYSTSKDNLYYPAKFSMREDGTTLYRFVHSSEGVPDKSGWIKRTKGILIHGTNAKASYKTGTPYDTLNDIEIIKE